MNSISLTELLQHVQETLKDGFSSPCWIRAEISEMRENQNGHCYLEFIEKDDNADGILAKSKAIIWASTYRMLKPYFESATGESLRDGMKVLVAVNVEFSAVYGFSLVVRDIDPAFTMGDLAARRLKIIRQLQADGISEMNKELTMASLPQRIAVISSPTAAGYEDFMHQLSNNPDYHFYVRLFPAIMQGASAEQSIIDALEKIFEYADFFDVVVIIRGGGATTDLLCFDSYDLAANCAQFPLPVLTGLGHQRDNTIVDMVAWQSLKTPTAVAEFILEQMAEAEGAINAILHSLISITRNRLTTEEQYLNNKKWAIKQVLKSDVQNRLMQVELYKSRIKSLKSRIMSEHSGAILLLESKLEKHTPGILLKYGYALLERDGKRVFSVNQLKKGDKIKAYMHDGNFDSTVN